MSLIKKLCDICQKEIEVPEFFDDATYVFCESCTTKCGSPSKTVDFYKTNLKGKGTLLNEC